MLSELKKITWYPSKHDPPLKSSLLNQIMRVSTGEIQSALAVKLNIWHMLNMHVVWCEQYGCSQP